MWTITTANISKDVEFVRHGIEEEVSELIQRLRKKLKNIVIFVAKFFVATFFVAILSFGDALQMQFFHLH